jgi:hypothetical protein
MFVLMLFDSSRQKLARTPCCVLLSERDGEERDGEERETEKRVKGKGKRAKLSEGINVGMIPKGTNTDHRQTVFLWTLQSFARPRKNSLRETHNRTIL